MNYQLVIFGIVVVFLLYLVWKLRRSKKLPSHIVTKFSAKINQTKTLAPAHSIMESHKIFTAALSYLFTNKKLTAAKKITYVQKQIPHIKSIWLHHTLRNRLAHETDAHASEMQAQKARRDFVKALEVLG